jgi:hypothetical protein
MIPPQTPKTSAHLCPKITEVEELKERNVLKAQSGEDEVLLKWFRGLCGGTYIEMGALDGIRYSNSYVFHEAFDWKGLLIELKPKSYESLKKNRPNELAAVHAAVCADDEDEDNEEDGGSTTGPRTKTVHFYDSGGDATAGVWEFTAPSFRDKWWGPNVSLERDTTPIDCRSLAHIIREEVVVPKRKMHWYSSSSRGNSSDADDGRSFFDFFSLDCEGCELVALQSVDWQKTDFGMIVVEADRHNPRKNLAIHTFLERRNYRFLEHIRTNDWYVHSQFDQIYHDLIGYS